MADPVTIALVASTGISAYSSIQQGKYAAAAAEAERQQYEEQREMAKLQAIEDANARKQEQQALEASNRALWAAKTGTDPGESGSFLALKNFNEQQGDRDIGAIRLMGKSQDRQYQLSSWNARLSGKAKKQQGYLQAASTMLGGYVKYKQIS